MGTRLQCESYPLGHYSVRDIDDDSTSSWSKYDEDTVSNELLFSGFKLKFENEYSGYDKKLLKRTMLEHEAIFRKQVCELHQLYRTQKDLMDKLKRQESCELHLQTRTSESHLFPSPIASETSEKIWQIPHQLEGATSFHMDSVADPNDIKPTFELVQQNCMLFSRSLERDGARYDDCRLSNSKPIGLSFFKEKLDLQLSADLYIDVDGSEVVERESISRSSYNSSMVCEVECESDVKLTLGSSEDPICSKGSWISDPIRQKSQSIEKFPCKRKTVEGLSCKGEAGSVRSHFSFGTINHEAICGNQLPVRSDRSSLPRDFFTDKQRNGGPFSDNGEAVLGWPPFNYEDGRKAKIVNSMNPGFSKGKLPLLSDSPDPNVKGAHRIPSHDHSKTHTCFEEKPILGVEPNQESSLLLDSNYLTNSEFPGSISVGPSSKYTSCAYPVVLPQRKPRRIITYVPIAVQALPCFPESELSSRHRKLKESVQNSSTAGNMLQSEGDLNSPLKVGVDLSSGQFNIHQNLRTDFNFLPQPKCNSNNFVYENPESFASQKLSKLPNEVNFSGGLPCDINGNEKLGESSECPVFWLGSIPSCDDSQGGFSFSEIYNEAQGNVLSSLHAKGRRKQRNSISHGSLPVNNNLLQQSTTYVPCAQNFKNVNRDVDTVAENRDRHCGSGIRDQINLNSLEISTENDVFNLEVPKGFYESLDSFAAENLVALSLDLTYQLTLASCDLLHWFAGVVSSESAAVVDADDNEVDVFESSTLKLEELKPEERLLALKDTDIEKDGNNSAGAGFLLLSKTGSRRGQARKRERLKDFQKDVLPGLVPLSRHEVIEDFQAFDCMMRAMGEDWQCNLTRRTTGHKARGRRRTPSLKHTVSEKHLSPLSVQAMVASSKIEVDRKSIVGWGRKTTRRGRRPRVVVPNQVVSASVCKLNTDLKVVHTHT